MMDSEEIVRLRELVMKAKGREEGYMLYRLAVVNALPALLDEIERLQAQLRSATLVIVNNPDTFDKDAPSQEPDFETMPIEQVNQYLRDHGYDPKQVEIRGKILTDVLIENIKLHADLAAALKRAKTAEKLIDIARRCGWTFKVDERGRVYMSSRTSAHYPSEI